MKRFYISSSLWLTFGLSIALLAAGIFPTITEPLLQFDRARIDAGEWWRLFTGQLVHFGFYHLLMNIAALLLCGFVLLRDIQLWCYCTLLLVSATVVGLGLYYFNPELFFYAGLSGVLHGLIIGGLLFGIRLTPIFNGIALLLVFAKIIHEQSAGFDTSHALLPVPVAVDAHAYGALAGLLATALIFAVKHFARNSLSNVKEQH
jgi:rhomboid family GlyGly-CTERM serine protease